MTRLSDTQAVILSAASQREDGAVLPLPETLKIKGGAVDKVLGSLKTKGLIGSPRDPARRQPATAAVITRAGLQAIGVETEDDASESTTLADTGATPAESACGRRPGARRADGAAPRAQAEGEGRPSQPAQGHARPRSPRRAPAPSRRR